MQHSDKSFDLGGIEIYKWLKSNKEKEDLLYYEGECEEIRLSLYWIQKDFLWI